MSAPLVHYRSPVARAEDPCLCGVSADDSPHVCLATALEALADHACAVCLARVARPSPLDRRARLAEYLHTLKGSRDAAVTRRDEAAETVTALDAEIAEVTADLAAVAEKPAGQ